MRHLDDPARRARRRRRRLPVRLPGAPALRPLPRARDLRDRRRDAGGPQEVRGLHRRRRRDQPLRPPELTGTSVRRGRVLGLDARPSTTGSTTSRWTIALVLLRASRGCSCAGGSGGRFAAVRDSETAAVSSGVSLARYKTLAFGISAVLRRRRRLAFAIATTFVNPDTFPVTLSIFLLVGVVVGGLGSLSGSSSARFHPVHAARVARSDVEGRDRRRSHPGARRSSTPTSPARAGGRLRRAPDPVMLVAAGRCGGLAAGRLSP